MSVVFSVWIGFCGVYSETVSVAYGPTFDLWGEGKGWTWAGVIPVEFILIKSVKFRLILILYSLSIFILITADASPWRGFQAICV